MYIASRWLLQCHSIHHKPILHTIVLYIHHPSHSLLTWCIEKLQQRSRFDYETTAALGTMSLFRLLPLLVTKFDWLPNTLNKKNHFLNHAIVIILVCCPLYLFTIWLQNHVENGPLASLDNIWLLNLKLTRKNHSPHLNKNIILHNPYPTSPFHTRNMNRSPIELMNWWTDELMRLSHPQMKRASALESEQ